MADIEIKGLAEVQRKLQELGKQSDKLVRPALRAGAKIGQGYMIAAAPVKSGKTKAAIKVRAGKRKKNVISMLVSIGKKWFSGATFYAGMVEWGHRLGRRPSKGDTLAKGDNRPMVPGTHWAERSFEAAKPEMKQRILTMISESIDRIVTK